MTASGWGAPDWRGDGEAREALPDIEDLPIAERGYDQEAVREAFDRFYRHAARLDSTLRVLESVEAFSRQARELRADIRSLRAASWGPAPSARHVWSVGHEAWAPEEPPGVLAASLPRLALWAVLIVAVGVGAALAELRTLVIVGLVLGAWALVGLIELVLASRRAVPLPAATSATPAAEPVRAPVEAAAVAEVAVRPVAAAQETMISAPVAREEPLEAEEPSEVEPVVEEELVSAQEPTAPEAAPAAAYPAVEGPGAAEEEAADEEHAADEVSPAEEPAAAAEPVPLPVAEAPAPKRGGLFRRRREEPAVDDTDPQLAVVEPAPGAWGPEESRGDPWEASHEPGADGEPDRVEAAAPPARGLLRRGRR